MKPHPFILALAVVLLTACQGNTPADQSATKTLDSQELSRLAWEHQTETRQERRNSNDTFIAPGTPVMITGVCELARDVPLFVIDWPEPSTTDLPDWRGHYRAHLENNAEVARMKQGQRYRVKGRIGGGHETMCYGAYFIDVESFTAID